MVDKILTYHNLSIASDKERIIKVIIPSDINKKEVEYLKKILDSLIMR